MRRQEHWEAVYTEKSDQEVSWYQADPLLSTQLITEACNDRTASIIDVGGGSSRLVEQLLDAGFNHLAVLDISRAAVDRARTRMGDRSGMVQWRVADITQVQEVGQFDVWHDRATYHFLTEASDRQRYAELVARSVPSGGHLIIAAFALDGPSTCSGLDVCRYNVRSLGQELGPAFTCEREVVDQHVTPSGSVQPFTFARFRRL
jgi:2-polyprenyl-3-methyl-5-hydroxy-6-metoxy-1,4-benzoquinol methylase